MTREKNIMMTRFDQKMVWTTAQDIDIDIRDMETTHILNTVNLLLRKPRIIRNMLIKDIEESFDFFAYEAYEPRMYGRKKIEEKTAKAKSIYNITSMDNQETRNFFLESELFEGFAEELIRRGVNLSAWLKNSEEEWGEKSES